MKTFLRQILIKSFFPVFAAVMLVAGIAYAVWTEPTASPPGNNAEAPVNVGSVSQYKSGALGIGGLLRGYSNAIFDGNVGIGTESPQVKLDVRGNTNIQGNTNIAGQLIINQICLSGDCRTSWPSASAAPAGPTCYTAWVSCDGGGNGSCNGAPITCPCASYMMVPCAGLDAGMCVSCSGNYSPVPCTVCN